MQRILDAMTGAPAFIRNGRLDILAATSSAPPLLGVPHAGTSRQHSRFVFLEPRSRLLYEDWDHVADEVVAILRSEAGRNHTTATSQT